MQKSFQRVNIPKLVLTSEEGINSIKKELGNLNDWKDIKELIPDSFKQDKEK